LLFVASFAMGTPAGHALVPMAQASLGSNTILRNSHPTDYSVTLVTVSFPFLNAGESRLLTGRILAENFTTSTPIEQRTKVFCFDAAGAVVGDHGHTSENHAGSSTPAGGNYPAAGQLATVDNWLFQPAAPGSYTCSLIAQAATFGLTDGANALRALASGTYLKYSTVDEAGAGQWLPNSCSSDGATGCQYIGGNLDSGAANPTSAYELYGNGAPGLFWLAGPSAVAVEAIGDAGVTSCPAGTSSCVSHGSATTSTVDASLDVRRIDAGGLTCETAAWPSSGYLRTVITNDAHHQKIHLHLARWQFNPATCGASRRFIVRIKLVYVGGNPVKLDGRQSSAVISNGLMMNLTS
jgi:hypothetical protein